MAQQHPLLPARTTRTHLLRLLPVVAALCLTGWMAAFSTDPAYAQSGDSEETCPGGGYNPTPTAVEIQAVPIVVESTTSDYFVLYVQHDVDEDTSIEIPVLIEKGAADTTTLAENVEALPKERYRVEKYQIANPADIDGDCIDDMTELQNLGEKNPLNPAAAIALSDGAVAIPDRNTFETLAVSGRYVKFAVFGADTDRPHIYFINTKTHTYHGGFQQALTALGIEESRAGDRFNGLLTFHPELQSADGSPGLYSIWIYRAEPFAVNNLIYTLFAANMPLLEDDFAFHLREQLQLAYRDTPLYEESRMHLLLDGDVAPEGDFVPINKAEGYGLLRSMDLEDSPNPRDVVIYEALPNELPRVAGIITTVAQTPLSHVNLRAVQDGVPNAFIRGALDKPDINALIGHYVQYTVTADGYTIRAATKAEIDNHYASSRPATAQTPQRDLSVTEITPLRWIGFDDWDAFGVKAANVAVLRALDFPEGTVPDGFAIPFYFYDEFMKHNGFYDDIREMLADPDFQSDFDTQESELKKLRKAIKKAETPQWIIDAIVEMNQGFPEGINRRYRSSTNNEDLPGFSGAGLYDSKSQKPSEDEEDLAKSLKEVYASLWNFRAFVERDFHRIDHLAAAMGILVHPSYQDEKVNGVAVSFDLIAGRFDYYYVNSQIGEDLVTNPEALSVPEEVLLDIYGGAILLGASNQVAPGQRLMSDDQLLLLRDHLFVIHHRFKRLYQPAADEPFAMEIEFKITSDDILSIKQARPWVFGDDTPSENTPATGAPTISGTPQVDQTLTADTSGIADEDGLDNVSYTYQWIAGGSDIDGATGSTYTLTYGEQGEAIQVKVSFTDDRNNSETRTSEATEAVSAAPNREATGAPTISGTPQVDQTLTADTSGIADEDGLDNVSYTYQWIAGGSDIDGATGSTYTLTYGEQGEAIQVKVSFTDDRNNSETRTSEATEAVSAAPNREATGAPTISGTPQVDQTLTADTSGIADEDGLDNVSYTYQWIAGGSDIDGATGSTYTLTYGEQGEAIQVKVSFTDDRNNSETRTSEATEAVSAAPNREATGAPTISGTPQVDQTLTADTSGIADEDGLDNVSYTYQWIAGGSDIDGATGSTYTLTYGEQGEAIQVKVSFTDDRNNSETRTSEATEAVSAAPNREATGAPTISGTPQVDQTLTADTSGIADEDGLDNVSYTYQWIAGGSDIDGATGSTYTLTYGEQGEAIQVKVSFTDDRNNPETRTSAATGVVAAKPNTPATGVPTIDGTAQVGETLTALTNGITDADGLTNPTYSHQWIRSDNGTDANITGQTDSTYTLVAADVGKTIKVRVSFTDDAENEESLTSAATAAVTAKANNPATGAPTISGTAQVDQTLTAGTSDIADSDGLTNVSYSYQWIRSDGGTDTDIVGETDSTYTLVSTDQGKTIKVKVTFTDDADNQESLTSAATATVVAKPNTAPTGLPTISGTARVDETLTADTSDIADDDGLTDPTFTYQWVAGGADISGATNYTYFLTSSEQGQTIQVQVSFTDDADNQERLTSVATAAIAPLSYSTVWSADMLVVEYTETSIGAASADLFSNIVGSRDPEIKSLWSHVPSRDIRLAFQEGISDADDLTLIVGELKLEFPPGSSGNSSFKWTDVDVDWEDGETIQVRIVQTSALEEPEKQEEPADNTPATGAPTISGTAQVDETLAAETSNIADDDGLTNVSYSYQWTRSDGSTYADIAGETDSTYTLVFADQGKTIKVRVTFTDDADNAESLTSVPTVAVAAAPNREATGQPTIGGTPQVGETLTADTSAIADEDGLTNVSYRYQWIWNDNGADTDMAGETSTTYTLVTADAGKTIKVRVSFSDDADNQESLTSVATDTVAAKPNSRATGAPTINGTAQVGETLTVLTNGITDSDGLTNVSYSYQWIRSDNGTDADIAGQRDSTYTLVSADQGKAIKVKVSFTDDTDHEETLTSAATAAVAARPNSPATGAPAISGTAQAGETLTADTSGIADADGLTNVSFSYQWIRNDGTTDTDIQGATSSTYTLSDADEGKTIKVRVSFTDRGGYQETLTSATTIIVDQPGTVSLWPELPRVGTVVRATLTDPDGLEGAGSGAAASLGAVSWQWARSSEGSTWTSVDVYADGDSYTPTEDDEGMWLEVTAVYTDGHGKGKSAEAITAAMVGAREASPELTVTALVTGLTHPWDIAFTPDGTMLFTERDDGLRVRLTDGTVRQVTADFSDLNFGGTAGLLALVLDPDFVSNRRFYTYQRHTGAEMQLIAWTIDEDYTTATRVADPLVGGIPVNLRHLGPSHGGGRLRFGPQGYLWVATGDGYSGTAAQDLSSLGGKVLRVDSQTGAGAPDNPFAPSPVYTYGHRNPQGLALRPGTGQMWSVEHGPDHDDEINLLVSGGNYGWDPAPDEGAEDLYDEITTPMTDLVKFPDGLEAKWSSGYPPLAVGGGVFLEGSQWREWEGRFAVATLKTKSVRVFKFTEEGDLVSQVVVPELDRTYSRLRTAVLGPDGALYITTTNGGGKDKILKVVPANTPATGLPTISGTAQVGETLTALTNGITDADGLTNVSYSYQWLADDANIQGATNSTYTLSDEDEGKSIKVRVSFTDDADNAETRTSEATDTVAATKPGVPGHLNVFPHGTGALDVYWEAPASDGGSAITGYKVQWKESADSWETPADVSEATVTGTTHTITGLTGGVEYTVRVSAVNDAGEGSPSAEASGTPQEAQIWSANLTVGIVAETFAGYTTFLPDSSVLGALSSDTITLDDASYTVKALGVLNGKLILSVMPKLTAGFVLVVGTEEFASTDASTLEGDSIIQFQWNDPGLDLPEGEEVAVRVTEPAENTPATGEPTITGTTQVGETLTADTSEIQDSNGRINVIFEYQWMVTDTEIDDATESTYTPSASDVGKTISVRVNFRDDAGYKESVTSQATEVVAATVPSAPQSMTVTSGSQTQELDVSWQAPSSNGGSAVTGYRVQWKESTDSWDTADDVSEATETGTTHTISGLTGGVEYAVRVMASNDVGDGPASTEVKGTPAGGVSEQTVEPENSAPTGLPSISGTPQVDQTLTADTSNIDDEDGLANVSYQYQWGAGGSDIDGATGSTYTLTYSEQGQTIQVQVFFTDDADNAETLTSAATVAVAAAPNRGATGQPSISGTPQVGQTLTADTSNISDLDGITNPTFAYQWRSGGLTIIGATGSTYTLTASDQGKTITVRVRFTDDRNNIESRISNATAAVAAKPNTAPAGLPTISGTPQVGETLTADTSAIADDDGLTGVSYSYQWIANDGTTDTDIAGQTDSAYTLTDDDAGKAIRVRVSFTDDADNQEFLTSADTDTVAATKPGVPGHLNIFPHDAVALDVYWEAPASDGGSDITGYKVQWKDSADSWDTLADVSEATASGTIHTITGLTDGVEYSVRVLATNGVGDSPPSVEQTGTPRETKAPEMVRPRVDGATLKVLYDEALDQGSAPPTDSFDVRVACTCDDMTWLDEESKRAVESVSVDGDTVVLTLVSAATSEDVVVVSYTPPSDAATARTRDLAGNAAAGFNSTEVFNDTDEPAESEENGEPEETTEGETPLTVSLEATTESHDGLSEFTFEIEFSEEFGLSYKTLRDFAFTETGGEVRKAQRMDKPSNVRWLITVEPNGNGDVTIELPATTDCAAAGAICTGDGRMLTNSLSFTVSGPGQ